MAELVSPAGTVVNVDGDLAERLTAQGWSSTDKPKRGRPQQTETEE
ncbi:hypothetical protein [Curtobacterium luteum]|nr:hypothetical protein [Curtobacterium luteum]